MLYDTGSNLHVIRYFTARCLVNMNGLISLLYLKFKRPESETVSRAVGTLNVRLGSVTLFRLYNVSLLRLGLFRLD